MRDAIEGLNDHNLDGWNIAVFGHRLNHVVVMVDLAAVAMVDPAMEAAVVDMAVVVVKVVTKEMVVEAEEAVVAVEGTVALVMVDLAILEVVVTLMEVGGMKFRGMAIGL